MLENIKSSFFIKILFNHLNEENKLKVAKYSKTLQNKIDINITNYKLFSRRNIIYETNGRAKELLFGKKLVYEGEYLNGKRNGKGKDLML